MQSETASKRRKVDLSDETKIAFLCEMFPSCPESVVSEILMKTDGNVSVAIDQILLRCEDKEIEDSNEMETVVASEKETVVANEMETVVVNEKETVDAYEKETVVANEKETETKAKDSNAETEPGTPRVEDRETDIERIMSVLPVSKSIAISALDRYSNNLDNCIVNLLVSLSNGKIYDDYKVTEPERNLLRKRSCDLSFANLESKISQCSYALNELFPSISLNEIRDVSERYHGDTEAAANAITNGTAFSNVVSYDERSLICANVLQQELNLDGLFEVQSLFGHKNPKKTILDLCTQHESMIGKVQAMLSLEKKYGDNYYVFYHSFSYSLFLYEIQSAIAQVLFHLPNYFPPLPRLNFSAFDITPSTADLLSKLTSDHEASFRGVAISVSNSLLAFESEAFPLLIFENGYSCLDLNFRQLLIDLLSECGYESSLIPRVINRLIEVGKKNHINTEKFTVSKSESWAIMPPEKKLGAMLQIFIAKEDVDHIAYVSAPFGRPLGMTTSEFLSKPRVDGQSRLFIHPQLFFDQKKALLFYYHAKDELCYGEMRENLLKEIKESLPELFFTPESTEKTRNRLFGREKSKITALMFPTK